MLILRIKKNCILCILFNLKFYIQKITYPNIRYPITGKFIIHSAFAYLLISRMRKALLVRRTSCWIDWIHKSRSKYNTSHLHSSPPHGRRGALVRRGNESERAAARSAHAGSPADNSGGAVASTLTLEGPIGLRKLIKCQGYWTDGEF